MATTSSTALRRFAGFAISLLLFSLCLAGVAVGQGATPLVTASAPVGLNHPTGWGVIQQTAITPNGDWLVVEFPDGGLFEFPADGSAMKTLVPLTGLGSKNGYQNPTLLLDPGNNIYLGGNWNNCLLEFNYDAATNSWPLLSTLTSSTNSASFCGTTPPTLAQYSIFGFAPYYFQPWGVALGTNNNLIVGNQNSGNFIFSMNIQGAWSNPSVAQASSSTTEILAKMTKRPISLAVDPEGDIFFVEDTSGLPGVYEIPAGATGLAADTDPSIVRVDPNLPSVTAVVTDPTGNLYISDSQQGIYVVPNPSGTPQTSAAYQLSAIPAVGEVAIDWARGILYTPTNQTQSNGQADVAKIELSHVELGASPVQVATANPASVDFTFNGNVVPDRATIMENGGASADFKITGGTCTMGGTGYTAGQSCAVSVSMTPHTVGSISGTLLLQKSDPVASSAHDYNDAVTAYSASGGFLTLTAANTLVAGEAVVIKAPAAGDALHELDGQEFYVLAAGLSAKQFEISTSSINSGASGTTAATAQARVFTTLSSMVLHGTGVGALMQAGPAVESNIGGSLTTPSQVTVDGGGNVYVADAGLGKVLMYPAGFGTSAKPTSIGTGLSAPTGVAVDGTGDIFIADSSNGSVYEIPALPNGLNANGGQLTLATGLGNNLRLAIDSVGSLYVADPANGRVVKLSNLGATGPSIIAQSEKMLTAGFTAPTDVAVDSSNNLYVIDGANLFELAGGVGSPIKLSSSLSGATGVAADASGAIYISGSGGTMRVPYVSGALAFGSATAVAATVTSPAAVAVDHWGNVYLADGAAENVHLVSTNGTLTFAPFTTPGQSASLDFNVTNVGNAPLSVTGYTGSSVPVVNNTQNPNQSVTVQDFTATDGTCVASSPVAAGGSCQVQVTLAPAPGEEGPLSGQLGLTSNSVNSPVIQASGVGAALSISKTSATVATGSEVVNTQVTVTVTPKSGTGTPQGEVALTYTSFYVDSPSSTGVPTIEPNQITVTSNLVSGSATFNLSPVLAGSQTMSVVYVGDPSAAYGRSTATVLASIAKSHIVNLGKDTNPPAYLPFVLEQSGSTPYDGSQTFWQYNMPVTVNTVAGTPTGTLTFMDNSTTCPVGTSATGQGAAICAPINYSGVACPLSPAVVTIRSAGTANSARATFASSCLPMPLNTTYTPVISTHYITPVYSGDANFLGFQGTTGANSDSYLFQALRSPEVIITSSPSSLTVAHGSSVSTTLTLTSLLGYGYAGKGGQLNDYNFPVTLSCDSLPPHSACTFAYPTTVNPVQPTAPNSVQIPCTGTSPSAANCIPGVVTLTLNTNVTVGTTTSQNATVASVTLASIFGFGMLGLFFRRTAFEKGRLLLMVLLAIVGTALAVSITACNTTNLSPNTVLSTPSGTYAMTVTAQQVGAQTINLPTGPISIYGSENQVSVPFYINVTVQ